MSDEPLKLCPFCGGRNPGLWHQDVSVKSFPRVNCGACGYGAHVEPEVLHAPPQACISGELLEWLEYSPWGGARFDGDVLAIHARNGRFCYRVDRRPLLRWMATAAGRAPPADYLMHRIDEVP